MSIRVLCGDAIEQIRTLADQSVNCCVTSPPYYGLRDYGTAKWEGGDAACNHSPEKRGGRFGSPVSRKQASNTGSGTASRHDCPCGAVRIDNQIGLEPTPDAYIAKLVEVFREVRRVLRDDGTLWLNLGDSYCAPGGGFSPNAPSNLAGSKQARTHPHATKSIRENIKYNLKPKDLLMIPARVALALQADGWWLRSEIIWAKPNPMPESVTDRPTSAHEKIYLLSKAARYWYDADAVREPLSDVALDFLRRANGSDGRAVNAFNRSERMEKGQGGKLSRADIGNLINPLGRNLRNVWTIATSPFPEAHFATFPPEIPERCIKAGCPVGGTVLDPFAGAGTTGLVADRLGRNAVLIELNPAYVAMLEARIRDDAPLFVQMVRV